MNDLQIEFRILRSLTAHTAHCPHSHLKSIVPPYTEYGHEEEEVIHPLHNDNTEAI